MGQIKSNHSNKKADQKFYEQVNIKVNDTFGLIGIQENLFSVRKSILYLEKLTREKECKICFVLPVWLHVTLYSKHSLLKTWNLRPSDNRVLLD